MHGDSHADGWPWNHLDEGGFSGPQVLVTGKFKCVLFLVARYTKYSLDEGK